MEHSQLSMCRLADLWIICGSLYVHSQPCTAPIKFAQAVQQSVHVTQETITRQTFMKFDIGEFM
jgi:hypothetical protein